jgi:hypothetical protein
MSSPSLWTRKSSAKSMSRWVITSKPKIQSSVGRTTRKWWKSGVISNKSSKTKETSCQHAVLK